jgi:predicted Zn-dependent protease with MMP-like domain
MLSASERRLFDQLLEKVLDELPDDVHALLDEVPLIVEDEPSEDLLRAMGIPKSRKASDLCGLQWGVPLSEKSVAFPETEPPRILIFRGPICRLAGRSREEREHQIRITLLHEIGHHFGLDEERLEELGYG